MATALDCRRGRTIVTTSASARAHSGVAWQATEAASVLRKSRVRRLRDAGEMPDPHDVLAVHAIPGGAEAWTITLRINFATKAAEEKVYRFRKDAARLDDEGAFAAAFVFVAGAGSVADGGFPYVLAVDVTEGSGSAPTVDVSGLGAGPATIQLEAPADEESAEEADGNLLECVCFPGPTFEFDRSFIRPTVVDTLQATDAALKKHPAARLFVVAHTDRVGDEQYNKDLADRRAYSTYCFITDDAAGWELLYQKEGWGLKTVQVILADLGHDPGAPDGIMGTNTRRAMRSFLGVPDETPVQNDAPFREKLFLAYMTGKHDVKATPDQFMSTRFTGCGEFNPIVPPNAAELANTAPGNEPNRRVVLYLFKEDEAVVPCQPHDLAPCKAEIAKPGERRFPCAFYDSIATRCGCEGPKPVGEEPPESGTATLVVVATQDDVPVDGATVKVFGPRPDPLDGETESGSARFEGLPEGSYIVNAAKLARYGVRQATLAKGETKTVRVPLDQPKPPATKKGKLTVRVTVKLGSGTTKAGVGTAVQLVGPGGIRSVHSSATGTETFGGLEPGTYIARATSTRSFESGQATVTLGEGEEKTADVTITEPAPPPPKPEEKVTGMRWSGQVAAGISGGEVAVVAVLELILVDVAAGRGQRFRFVGGGVGAGTPIAITGSSSANTIVTAPMTFDDFVGFGRWSTAQAEVGTGVSVDVVTIGGQQFHFSNLVSFPEGAEETGKGVGAATFVGKWSKKGEEFDVPTP